MEKVTHLQWILPILEMERVAHLQWFLPSLDKGMVAHLNCVLRLNMDKVAHLQWFLASLDKGMVAHLQWFLANLDMDRVSHLKPVLYLQWPMQDMKLLTNLDVFLKGVNLTSHSNLDLSLVWYLRSTRCPCNLLSRHQAKKATKTRSLKCLKQSEGKK